MTDIKISPVVNTACKSYNEETYISQTAFYKDRKRPELRDFIAYCYNAAERYLETGTVQHLRNGCTAGRATGRYRMAVSLLKVVSAHPWNGAKGTFGGTMDKKRMAKLRDSDAWKHDFRVRAQTLLNADAKSAEAQSAWDMDKAVLTLVKKAMSEKGGKHTEKEIKASLEGALKAVANA